MSDIHSKWKHDFINLLTLPHLRITDDGILWEISRSYKINKNTYEESFEYYNNGVLRDVMFRKNNNLNNLYRYIPADYGYDQDGKLVYIEYAKRGKLHNLRGYASLYYPPNCNKILTYAINNVVYTEDEYYKVDRPAITKIDKN